MKGFTSVLLATICCITLATQDSKKPASAKAAAAGQMQMPTPGPEMTKLIKSLGGNWMVTEKHLPNPMMPKGGTGKGTAILTPGPGNLSLTEKYSSIGAMGKFNGMGVLWWDAKAGAYRGLCCDNMTPTGCDASGTTKWEGDKLVGNMEMDMGGQKMAMRFTYSDFKPGSFMMTMEMGPDANSLKPSMEVTYRKAGGAAKAASMEKPAQ